MFFGPGLTAVPHDADAVRLFDAFGLLASVPHLFEIERPLAGRLDCHPPWPHDAARLSYTPGG